MEKFALITGASGGIGAAIARKLYLEGYSLYLHYHSNEITVNNLKNELSNEVQSIHVIQADLSHEAGLHHLLDQIQSPIHSIVYNCGQSYYGLITDTSAELTQQMVYLHLTCPFLLVKALLPQMISNRSGNIVFITSIWGLTGASCEVLYSMVKGGQNTFVKALAKETAPSGIRVNAIAPGAIHTNMLSGFSEDEISLLKEEIPMGRIGEPDEVAEAVSFLLSDKSSYMTGQIICLNGGWFC